MTTGTIRIADRDITYSIRVSQRAKRLRIAVYPGEKIVVTKPHTLNHSVVEKFLVTKADWVSEKLSEGKIIQSPDLLDDSYNHFLFNRGRARKLVKDKLARWNEVYNFEFRRIGIKQLKSRWGSCSSDSNLSFNYKLLFLPEQIQDLIIVHELCHLRERNHSKAFWDLVYLTQPDFKRLTKQIKKL